jgi:hypothetical protein
MSIIKQILFFGLRQDLMPVFEDLERAIPLAYTKTGRFLNRSFDSFDRASKIPNLGIASADTSINCETYLAGRQDISIVPRVVNEINAGETFRIDQMLNPDTVAVTPAGVHGEEIILQGRVATISNSQQSQFLMRTFQGGFRRQSFLKIKAFWVGPHALVDYKAGKRLTTSVQSPKDLDLAEPM